MYFVWSEELRAVKNHTLAFKLFFTPQPGDVLTIAASNLYRLFIDGEFVGYGPARAAHGYTRVDNYNLSSFENNSVCIVVEVFAANINSYYIVDELPFFGVEIKRDNNCIISTQDFCCYQITDRVTKVQRFSFQRTFVESYVMDRCRKEFYCSDTDLFPKIDVNKVSGNTLLERNVPYVKWNSVFPISVKQSGFVEKNNAISDWDDRCYLNIGETLKGYSKSSLSQSLSAQVSSLVFKPNQINGGLESAEEILMQENDYITYDFGRAVTGFNKLLVTAKTDAKIMILFDEMFQGERTQPVDPFRNGCCNVQKFELKAGGYSLQLFEANTLRYASIVVLEGEITLNQFSIVLYENTSVNEINVADSELQAIITAAKHTFAQNAVDLFMDCPSRERAGWLCDGYFTGFAEYFFTGSNIVEHNFLENYILAPQSEYLPKNMLPMCYPADHNDGVFIPNWAMWFVIELYAYTLRTGDKVLANKAKSKIYGLIDYFTAFENEDGLLENLEGWVFIEWSKCNDKEHTKGVNYPTNMLYSKMFETIGIMYDDEKLIKRGNKIKHQICKQSWNGTFFEDNSVRKDGKLQLQGHLTETCQYYAFFCGVAQSSSHPELFAKLLNELGPNRKRDVYPEVAPSNAFIGNYLRLEIMLADKRYDEVLRDCKAYFLPMAKLTGTLWEHDKTSASLNHGFASIVAYYIMRALEKQ